jgi:hypothetical protein
MPERERRGFLRGAIPIALSMVLLAGFTAPSVAGPDDPDAEQVLAVVNTGGGTFRETGHGYRLTLTEVAPRAVWFSDRPSRDAGSYAIDELEDVFFVDEDAPNAALEVFSGRGAGEVVVVELASPRYEAKAGRLVLDARVLGRDEVLSTALEGHAELATDDPPNRFGSAALFIDDASGGCPAGFWAGQDGVVVSMSNIDCLEAQAVIAQALAQHPANIGSDQYDYDFAFYNETWHSFDQHDRATFNRTDSPDNVNARQSFEWHLCTERGGNEYC